jgi:hypothetical protein
MSKTATNPSGYYDLLYINKDTKRPTYKSKPIPKPNPKDSYSDTFIPKSNSNMDSIYEQGVKPRRRRTRTTRRTHTTRRARSKRHIRRRK